MQMSLDDHRESVYGGAYEMGELGDESTRYVSPPLAHQRAGDKNFLTLVPACPLCQATILAQAEQYEALKELVAATKAADAAKLSVGGING